MTAYRRNFVPGGSFFFTVNLADRRLSLLTAHIEFLRDAFRETCQRHPFTIDAIVVLPDHVHAVWTMPDGDADFATRWRLIKATFSRSLSRGAVGRVREWEASSFHQYLKLGIYLLDWAGDISEDGS